MRDEAELLRELRALDGTLSRTENGLHIGIEIDNPDAACELVAELDKVLSLQCSGCPLTDVGIKRLIGLRHLRSVDIVGTLVTGKGLDVIESWSSLAELSCNPKVHADEGVQSIGRCNQLERLSISGSGVSDDGFRAVGQLKAISSLNASCESVSSGAAVLGEVPSLRELSLERTKIDDEVLSAIAFLPILEELYIGQTCISDVGVRSLARLERLRVLALNATAVTAVGLASIAELPTLTKLFIRHVRVDSLILKVLQRMTQLTHLYLDGDDVLSRCRNDLQVHLPNCEITWF